MTVVDVVARIQEIQSLLSPRQAARAQGSGTSFQATLQGATGSSLGGTPTASAASRASLPAGVAGGVGGVGAAGVPGAGSGVGARMVALAQQEVGVAEQPPGSNDAPRIAEYRRSTAGGGVGPWCAYFVSWAAAQSGMPLGEAGQGFANVAGISGWAERTGRNLPAGTRPQPGDIIYWGGDHVGLVESVDPDGGIHTIEGNSSNAVSRRTYGPDGGGATGYVRL